MSDEKIKQPNNKITSNPYQNPDHRFMQQIFVKEINKRNMITEKLKSMTKPRNPLLGQETHRENPEFYINPDNSIKSKQDYSTTTLRYIGERIEPLGSQIGVVNSLHKRRSLIQSQLEQMQKTIEHKKLCMSLTSEFSNPQILHPGMEQTTLNRHVNTLSNTINSNKQSYHNNKMKNLSSFSFENNSI